MVDGPKLSQRKTAAHVRQRTIKWALMYLPQEEGVVKGVLINPSERDRLANWMCGIDACKHHKSAIPSGLVKAGGACDDCLEQAAFWLAECPYLDMGRSPRIKFEGLE